MSARVSEEAEAFLKLAPLVLGTEKLHQMAQKPPPRFRPRIGAAAKKPPAPQWIDREVISEYGFAVLAGETGALHELRQVTSVDGRKVEDTKKAQAVLSKAITSSGDGRKRELLKAFEKYGLGAGATDFGQLILLFTRRGLERYEFTQQESRMIGYDRALVFAYKQIDGPEALTLFEANKNDQTKRLRAQGEIRVRAEDFVPLQILLMAQEGEGANLLREEAAVNYSMSPFGAVLPTSTEHRELRGGKVVAENHFTYSDFHKFGASSDIKFEVEPEVEK
jgi:hypothetical protein